MKGNAKVADLVDESVNMKGATIVDTLKDVVAVDKKKDYENAWAKVMQGKKIRYTDKVLI